MAENNLVKITGLWLNESQAGNKYFSGSMGSAKVLIFKNNNKTEEKQPDYTMYLAPPQQQQQQPAQQDSLGYGAPQQSAAPQQQAQPAQQNGFDYGPPPMSDDVPF